MPIFDGVSRRISFLAALVTLTAAGLATALTSGRPAAAAGLVVRVSGNRLVDRSGQPLWLLGVNRSGTEYACAQGWASSTDRRTPSRSRPSPRGAPTPS